MKYFFVTVLGFVLLGCNTAPTPQETDPSPQVSTETPDVEITTQPLTAEDVESTSVETVGESEVCGGPENKLCASGFYCIKETQTQESLGTCVSLVVNTDMTCSEVHDPVCGLWKGQKKMGFQNPCQLERHGAEFLNKGFCGRKNSFEEPCEAKVLSIGINCNKYFTGYQFNGSTCEAIDVQGCDIETPFESLEACTSSC